MVHQRPHAGLDPAPAPQGVTLKHYQDFGLFDLWAEIRKLPGIKPKESESFVATGTDEAQGVVPGVAPTGGISRLRVATFDTLAEPRRNGDGDATSCPDSSKHRLASSGRLGDAGLEPATSCVSSRRSRSKNGFADPRTAFLSVKSALFQSVTVALRSRYGGATVVLRTD